MCSINCIFIASGIIGSNLFDAQETSDTIMKSWDSIEKVASQKSGDILPILQVERSDVDS